MSNSADFAPNWASPPGETIAEVLSSRGWTGAELASRMGKSTDVVEDLLSGTSPITIGIARELNRLIGASVSFWMTRDLQYRKDLERLKRAQETWVRSFPVGEMVDLGWLPQESEPRAQTLLKFFGVESMLSWHRHYGALLNSVGFRTSPAFESDPSSVLAWIRQGERVAAEVSISPWSPDAVRTTLDFIRGLTRIGHPERFLPKLKTLMGACGVAVAVVPAPSGCRASGAALWTSTENGLILLSARHLSDDHFWFSFFHECGHLLLHRDVSLFLDHEATLGTAAKRAETSTNRCREREANAFAEEVLLTPAVMEALKTVSPTYKGVLRLATRAGIAPGILVGQLQRMGRLGPERLNRLKRRYQWMEGQLLSRRSG